MFLPKHASVSVEVGLEGLRVTHVSPEQAADKGITAAIASIGRAAGPPWAADQRHAAAAWVALS